MADATAALQLALDAQTAALLAVLDKLSAARDPKSESRLSEITRVTTSTNLDLSSSTMEAVTCERIDAVDAAAPESVAAAFEAGWPHIESSFDSSAPRSASTAAFQASTAPAAYQIGAPSTSFQAGSSPTVFQASAACVAFQASAASVTYEAAASSQHGAPLLPTTMETLLAAPDVQLHCNAGGTTDPKEHMGGMLWKKRIDSCMPTNCSTVCSNLAVSAAASGLVYMVTEEFVFDPGILIDMFCSRGRINFYGFLASISNYDSILVCHVDDVVRLKFLDIEAGLSAILEQFMILATNAIAGVITETNDEKALLELRAYQDSSTDYLHGPSEILLVDPDFDDWFSSLRYSAGQQANEIVHDQANQQVIEFWSNSNDVFGPKCDRQIEFVQRFKAATQVLKKKGHNQLTHYTEAFILLKQYKIECINHISYCANDQEQDTTKEYDGKTLVALALAAIFLVLHADITTTLLDSVPGLDLIRVEYMCTEGEKVRATKKTCAAMQSWFGSIDLRVFWDPGGSKLIFSQDAIDCDIESSSFNMELVWLCKKLFLSVVMEFLEGLLVIAVTFCCAECLGKSELISALDYIKILSSSRSMVVLALCLPKLLEHTSRLLLSFPTPSNALGTALNIFTPNCVLYEALVPWEKPTKCIDWDPLENLHDSGMLRPLPWPSFTSNDVYSMHQNMSLVWKPPYADGEVYEDKSGYSWGFLAFSMSTSGMVKYMDSSLLEQFLVHNLSVFAVSKTVEELQYVCLNKHIQW